jgi:hypothetical protein
MQRAQPGGKRALGLDRAAQWHNPREVAHRFVRRLLCAVCDRRADEDVLRARPA